MKLMIIALLTLGTLAAQAATTYDVSCKANGITISGTVSAEAEHSSGISAPAAGNLGVVTADSSIQREFVGTVATQDFNVDKSAQRMRIELWTDSDTKPLYAFSITQVEYADGSKQTTSVVAIDQQPYQADCSVNQN